MNRVVILVVLLNCFHIYHVHSVKLPGPLVYVVTPSSRTPQNDEGRSAPFYYHKWMSRMDTPRNATDTITTTEKPKTPDLIFAEFESDNNHIKSIRKLLEKEKIHSKTTTTTTARPIYVPDEEAIESSNYGLPKPTTKKPQKVDMTDYFALNSNAYNSGPVYVPPTSPPVVQLPPATTTTTPSTTTSQAPINNVQNIWHIIDSEKQNQFSQWEEEPISSEQSIKESQNEEQLASHEAQSHEDKMEDAAIDENFAIPGFGTNPGSGAENESRAIRTEPNFRFPYVDLKPFQMKNMKKSQFNSYSSGSKGHNMFNLDSFTDIKNPIRGEVQDTEVPMHQPIDRYNSAQPYLPKQSPPAAKPAPPPAPSGPPPRPVNTVARLVPPPPPPPPSPVADDFPTPSTYDSFPPYAPAAPAPRPVVSSFVPSDDMDSDSPPSDNDGPPSDIGYRYKPPSAPSPPFAPTISPPSKPFMGYSYDKPSIMLGGSPPMMDSGSKPDFGGYHYSKPEAPPLPPPDNGPSYGHHDEPPPSYKPESDYPELVFDKPPGSGDHKGHDMGMMPPPPPPADTKPDMDSHGPPMDDHGFPHDFPGDLKFHHDFDEHDHDHYHYHHPTTTTTTEMPRVNRYSYYYLGKKLYYLPLYFSVYFIVYVGALIIKAVLRHKITYPNSYRPNTNTATFFSKRSIESHLAKENLHEITGRVTAAIAAAAEKYVDDHKKLQ
ncbi:unnamed protein product [Chrysodeixis includens]|uniref:Uncharacterized protein n=1 Tax=Chrysodeixis includens TaxID=689277 RepID=A0A9P0FWE8_CHRIL|nr:unnamed protein product [Chrysodeixis includens]